MLHQALSGQVQPRALHATFQSTQDSRIEIQGSRPEHLTEVDSGGLSNSFTAVACAKQIKTVQLQDYKLYILALVSFFAF